MRAGAHALLPFFFACVAFVLITALWQGAGSNDYTSAAARHGPSDRATTARADDRSPPAQHGDQALLRGQLLDSQSGEPIAAQVTLFGPRGVERHAEAGADGIFQVGCSMTGRVTLAIPRTAGHFGLFREFDLTSRLPTQSLKLEKRRDLPVVLHTSDGRALAEVAPPSGPWARESWPSILITQAPPAGHSSEGGADPLLATRVGCFLSSVLGDVPLRPGSPACCVGYVRLFEAPPLCCSLVIGSRVLQTIELDGSERLLSFVVDPSELRGALADVELRVADADTGMPPDSRRGLWLGLLGGEPREIPDELDADGRLVLHDVPAGAYELHLRLSGYEHEIRRVDLRAGEHNELGELRLRKGACVAGHILSETGEPVRARVWSSTRDGRDHAVGAASDTPADADWFAICGLPRASVLVGLDDPQWAQNPVEVDLSGGSVQSERLVARRGSLLRVIGPYAAAGAAILRILDGKRVCVWKGGNLEEEVHELRLLPGRYTIEVRRESGPSTREEVELGAESDATILLR